MGNELRLKRSSTASAVPVIADLLPGELAINTADGIIYFEQDGAPATIQQVITSVGGQTIFGNLISTGSLVGNNLQASSTTPYMVFNETDATLDQKLWWETASAEAKNRYITDDAIANSYAYETIQRSGTGAGVQVDTIDFASATDITLTTPSIVLAGPLTTGNKLDINSTTLTGGTLIDAGTNSAGQNGVAIYFHQDNASATGDLLYIEDLVSPGAMLNMYSEGTGNMALFYAGTASVMTNSVVNIDNSSAATNSNSALRIDDATAGTNLHLAKTTASGGIIDIQATSATYAGTALNINMPNTTLDANGIEVNMPNGVGGLAAFLGGDVEITGDLDIGTQFSTNDSIAYFYIGDSTKAGPSLMIRGGVSSAMSIFFNESGVGEVGSIVAQGATNHFQYNSIYDHQFRLGGTERFNISASSISVLGGPKFIAGVSNPTRAGMNIPEGTAPTTPVDGDMWITAAGAFNVRLNGVTVDVATGGGGLFTEDGDSNIVGGTGAGANLTAASGLNNFFAGIQAGAAVTTGDYNIAIGTSALYQTVGIATGGDNIAIGRDAMNNATLAAAHHNIALGLESLDGLTGGDYNLGVGYRAGNAISTGNKNIVIGDQALYETTAGVTGSDNIAIGSSAMGQGAATSANQNIAIGQSSLSFVSTSNWNIGIGSLSGYAITTGQYNVALGYQALYDSSVQALTGDNNVAIGRAAMASTALTTAFDNVAIGYLAGGTLSTGDSNVLLGPGAGANITVGGSNVIIGDGAGPTANQTDRLYIGNAQSNTPLIYGDFAAETVGMTAGLTVNGPANVYAVVGNASGAAGSFAGGGQFTWATAGAATTGVALAARVSGGVSGTNDIGFEMSDLLDNLYIFNDWAIEFLDNGTTAFGVDKAGNIVTTGQLGFAGVTGDCYITGSTTTLDFYVNNTSLMDMSGTAVNVSGTFTANTLEADLGSITGRTDTNHLRLFDVNGTDTADYARFDYDAEILSIGIYDDSAAQWNIAYRATLAGASELMYDGVRQAYTANGSFEVQTLFNAQDQAYFSASTTARPSLNIAEGVAPTTPVDGDVWVTAAGAFNARLNGVSVDLAAAGGGGAVWSYTLQTGTTYTAVAGDFVVASNTGTVTITLPTPAVDDTIIVKKTGATGTVTVDGAGAHTIDGVTTFVLSTQYASVTLIADTTSSWLVV